MRNACALIIPNDPQQTFVKLSRNRRRITDGSLMEFSDKRHHQSLPSGHSCPVPALPFLGFTWRAGEMGATWSVELFLNQMHRGEQ